ncbi:MAG: glutamate mutase L [Caldilinea sp.]|nr:glutamate mutase L [Caldilinea sp.]MDW8442553.1 glutamate mutase L [Caldilineaceae bacterium]
MVHSSTPVQSTDSPEALASGGATANDGSILALGVEVNQVRACLLENVNGVYRLAAWKASPHRRSENLATAVINLCCQMGDRLGRLLVDATTAFPLIDSPDPVRFPPLSHVAVAASPRPPVRVWVAGLSSTQSMAAAHAALCSAPAQAIGSTTLDADLNVTELANALVTAAPDMLAIVGGFDDPAPATHRSLLELSRIFGQALSRLAPTQRPVVVYAGNRWAAPHAAEALRAVGGGVMEVVANVQPAPGVIRKSALAQACNFYYWRLSRRTPGLRALSQWVTPPGQMLSLENAFTRLVRTWMGLHELPELHGLYCAPLWWLHVWTTRGRSEIELRFVEPQTRPATLAQWPALQLVSGEWPTSLWAQPELFWWDRSGMAPMVAAVGQSAPRAMLQVLRNDLLRMHGPHFTSAK